MKCAETESSITTKQPVFVASEHCSDFAAILSQKAVDGIPLQVRRTVQCISPNNGINVYAGKRTPVKRGNHHPVDQGDKFLFSISRASAELFLPKTIGKLDSLEPKRAHAA